jgi:hypothetical protein
LDLQKNNTTKKDKPAAEPIVVPIVLRMSDFDHKVCFLSVTNLDTFMLFVFIKLNLVPYWERGVCIRCDNDRLKASDCPAYCGRVHSQPASQP